MTTTREKIEIMEAFEAGKEIEYVMVRAPKPTWLPATTPTWSWERCNYRIKPEPKLVETTRYVVLYPNGYVQERDELDGHMYDFPGITRTMLPTDDPVVITLKTQHYEEN
jgi:hypothetical protein